MNDKRNGKFKGYNKKGLLIFESEFKNGEKMGQCKAFDSKGEIEFEGEYLPNNLRRGKNYEKGEIVFEGESNSFFNGMRKNGFGKEYWLDNLIFEGTYKDWKKTGHLKEYDFYSHLLEFDGEIKGDIKNGKGKEYLNGHLLFEGEFLNGIRWNGTIHNFKVNSEYKLKNGNGSIKELDENGNIKFEGQMKEGKKFNGKAEEFWYEEGDSMSSFKGVYLNGLKKGKVYYGKILLYEGEMNNDGEYDGNGIEYNGYIGEKVEKIFEGEFKGGNWWNGFANFIKLIIMGELN